jgi:hypothetical protein
MLDTEIDQQVGDDEILNLWKRASTIRYPSLVRVLIEGPSGPDGKALPKLMEMIFEEMKPFRDRKEHNKAIMDLESWEKVLRD